MINLILIFLISSIANKGHQQTEAVSDFFTIKCSDMNEKRIKELFDLELKLYLQQSDTEHKIQMKNSKLLVKCRKSKFSVIISNETTKRSASRIFTLPENSSDKERIIAIAASQMLYANLEKRIKEIHRLKILKKKLKNYKIRNQSLTEKLKNTDNRKLFFSAGGNYIFPSKTSGIPFYSGYFGFGKRINKHISFYGKTSFYRGNTNYSSGSVQTSISRLSSGIIFDILLIKNFAGIYAETSAGITHVYMKGDADDMHTDGTLSRLTSSLDTNLGIFIILNNSFKIRISFSIETFFPEIKGIVSDDNDIVIGGLWYGAGISFHFLF